MSLLHSSTRRPAPLKDTDYDHEIRLIDRTIQPCTPRNSRSQSAGGRLSSTSPISESSSRRHSDVVSRKHTTPLHLREELTRRKYAKYQDRRLGGSDESQIAPEANDQTQRGEEQERGRTRDGGDGGPKKAKSKATESAIDILYENQRGGFLCGMPLFSSKALGNLDPSPWTNSALKTSATNPTNAQVPDPSWEWAWKSWSINHSDVVDDDGWEYSFAFAKAFSWHGPTWWNSCVRRRAWIRKRVKRHMGYRVSEAHMLNSDYFTIHPAEVRSRSQASTLEGSSRHRHSVMSLAKREVDEEIIEDIRDIGSLMRVLRFARIDREKMEAVESFVKHGGEDLYFLREKMHDIMHMFIFQASRRLLLTHLLKTFNDASEQQKLILAGDKEVDPAVQRRLDNLEAAVKHADEEVKKLEFWSDVKDMAEKGHTKGAVDESQGWDQSWIGLDDSGPKDVISSKHRPGLDSCKTGEGNGTEIDNVSANDKGKGKAIG